MGFDCLARWTMRMTPRMLELAQRQDQARGLGDSKKAAAEQARACAFAVQAQRRSRTFRLGHPPDECKDYRDGGTGGGAAAASASAAAGDSGRRGPPSEDSFAHSQAVGQEAVCQASEALDYLNRGFRHWSAEVARLERDRTALLDSLRIASRQLDVFQAHRDAAADAAAVAGENRAQVEELARPYRGYQPHRRPRAAKLAAVAAHAAEAAKAAVDAAARGKLPDDDARVDDAALHGPGRGEAARGEDFGHAGARHPASGESFTVVRAASADEPPAAHRDLPSTSLRGRGGTVLGPDDPAGAATSGTV